METIPYIKFRISASRIDTENKYTLAHIHLLEDTVSTSLGIHHAKYLQDMICHALSLAHGTHMDKNDRFTYTFPFKL